MKTCLCYDYGNSLCVPTRLARDTKTLYFRPWKDGGATTSHKLMIGFGLQPLERVRNFWNAVNYAKPDFLCFTDVLDGDIQVDLRKRGLPVWGAGTGEDLELYRTETKKVLKKVGLPVGEYEVVDGIKALRAFCRKHDGETWFIKGNLTRSDWETYKHCSWFETEAVLDEWANRHQGVKEIFQWVCEKDIPDAIELAYDDISIVGKFPTGDVMLGVETKDAGYFCKVVKYKDLPESVRLVNEKVAPVLKACDYRACLSIEIRLKDGKPYVIDFTCRFPEPPTALATGMWENYTERIEGGANGEVVEAKMAAPYGAQIILKSAWAEKGWMPVKWPKESDPYIKFKNLCRVNGVLKTIPAYEGLQEVGAAIGYGSSPKSAIQMAVDHAEKVEGLELKFDETALDKAVEEMNKVGK